MSWPAVSNHGWPKRERKLHAKRITSCLLSFQVYPPVLVHVRIQHRHCRTCHLQVQKQSEVTKKHQESGAQKIKNKIKRRMTIRDAEERLRNLPEWLEEFTDSLEDTETPVLAHVSQDTDSERPAKVASRTRRHSIFTHFPKDRNCEVCMWTKITKAPCRRRTGEAVPRAEKKFGDLITADQKVLNEESESRNNHRYAVVVQDLATQWIQSYPV